jgi:hypothetical protein
MKTILKSISVFVLFFLLLVPLVFAESEYVDQWVGTWTVTMRDGSVDTWELTDTWVSDTGMSHLIYGVTGLEDVEFLIVYNGMFSIYIYIEVPYGTTVYDLPQDLSKYTELVPADDFQTFTAIPVAYPIDSGYKGTVAPEPEPCAASFLLGDDHSGLDTLRQFRDERIGTVKAGKTIISLYYEASDDIIALCEKTPGAKHYLARILKSLLPVIKTFCREE